MKNFFISKQLLKFEQQHNGKISQAYENQLPTSSDENRKMKRGPLLQSVGQSLDLKNNFSIKQLPLGGREIWMNLGEIQIRRATSAMDLPKPGFRLMSFAESKKGKRKKKKGK